MQIVHCLRDHEIDLLANAMKRIDTANVEFHNLLYVMVGPEHSQNPTLKLDVVNKRLTVDDGTILGS